MKAKGSIMTKLLLIKIIYVYVEDLIIKIMKPFFKRLTNIDSYMFF